MSKVQGGINQIVTDGLVFYIDAANHKSYISGSGDTSDSTTYSLINNITGSVSSSVIYDTDNLGSWRLDEIGKINCQDPYPTTYSNLSFACWVYVWNLNVSGAPYGDNNDLVSKWDVSSSEKVFRLQIQGTSITQGSPKIIISADGGTDTATFTHSDRVEKGNWYYIVGTHDNIAQKIGISVNGNPFEITDYSSGAKIAPNQVKIGGINDENSWGGKIACVQLYSKPLSDEEALQNYNSLKHRFNL